MPLAQLTPKWSHATGGRHFPQSAGVQEMPIYLGFYEPQSCNVLTASTRFLPVR